MSASEQAAWFMVAAARGHGSQALAPPGDAGMAASEAALGRDLLRLFFGDSVPGRELPALVAAVIASPRSGEALTALDVYLDEALEQDAELAAAVEEMLARFFREQLESGDGQTLAELGNLSWRALPPDGRRCGQLQPGQRPCRSEGAGGWAAGTRPGGHRGHRPPPNLRNPA